MLIWLFIHFNVLLDKIVTRVIRFQLSGKNEHFVYDVMNLIVLGEFNRKDNRFSCRLQNKYSPYVKCTVMT